jgi:hypothetical protein
MHIRTTRAPVLVAGSIATAHGSDSGDRPLADEKVGEQDARDHAQRLRPGTGAG